LFFISFYLLVSLLFVQTFIGVVLEYFKVRPIGRSARVRVRECVSDPPPGRVRGAGIGAEVARVADAPQPAQPHCLMASPAPENKPSLINLEYRNKTMPFQPLCGFV
jgi:hypothetical protein